MKPRSKGSVSGRSIPIVKCELCGWDIPHDSAVQRELEGMSHYFCSTDCELEWEQLDGGRVPARADPDPKPGASE